ncbi:MAG TPA: glycosyltransferase [Anaeromyxobacter sp.]|nr:glycosyltransferase [Anaeromyxobacter sp.]
MPRLLIVTTVPASFPFFLPYADYFRRAGWRVDALTGTLDGFTWHDRFDAVHAVDWSRDPRALHRVARAAGRVREIVRAGGYDLVHVHTPVASFVTRFALRNRDPASGPKVVYTAHGFHFHAGNPAWKNAVFAGLEKLAARWTDWLVVMNQEDEAAARRLRFLPDDRIWRMPGIGVDLRRYAPESVAPGAVAALREELRLGDDPALLMVAEFTARKRHVDALAAFAALAADRSLPRVRLLLAGVGPLRPAIERQAHAMGLSRRVHFLGLRPDVPALMKASRALLLPSTQEGLPRCVLEAMAMGLPVVATRIRGTTELLEGGCGTLVEVGDAVGLAAGARAVLRDPAAAAAAAARARVRAARYDEPAVVEQHVRLYAAALAGRKVAQVGAARPQSAAV